MKLRAAGPADAAAVASCVDALDDYAEVLRTHRCFVIEDGASIVALAVLVVEAERALLDNVAVLPAWQGRGLGRRLISSSIRTS